MNSVALAQILVNMIGIYLAVGLIFTVIFIIWGAGQLDPGARKATLGFRVIIIPGVILLWPLLARLWRRSAVQRSGGRHADRANPGI